MDERRCHNCLYARRPTSRLLKLALHDFPGLLICFRCAEADGQMTGVAPCGTCRNYRKQRQEATPAAPADGVPIRRGHTPKVYEKECRIPLSRGLFARVDPEDFEELSRYKWSASQSGKNFYAVRQEKGRTILMHRQIMAPPEGMIVDHINRNKLDNSRANLRVCSHRENTRNRAKPYNTPGFLDQWIR